MTEKNRKILSKILKIFDELIDEHAFDNETSKASRAAVLRAALEQEYGDYTGLPYYKTVLRCAARSNRILTELQKISREEGATPACFPETCKLVYLTFR